MDIDSFEMECLTGEGIEKESRRLSEWSEFFSDEMKYARTAEHEGSF